MKRGLVFCNSINDLLPKLDHYHFSWALWVRFYDITNWEVFPNRLVKYILKSSVIKWTVSCRNQSNLENILMT